MAVPDMDVLTTEALVIGSGSTGGGAAIELGEQGIETIVLSKGPMAKSGTTPLGFTGFQAVTVADPEDDPDQHFRDSVLGGRFLGDQNLVEVMTQKGGSTVDRLRGYGVRFQEEGGTYLTRQVPGITRRRLLRIGPGGIHLHQVLRDRVKQLPSVQVLADTTAVRLLKRDGEVVGALVYDMRRDAFFVVQAKVTILATGGNEQIWPYTDCPPETTGDGYALAYEAGAELVDMEQELFYPTVCVYPTLIRGLELSYESFFRPSARFLNGLGEEFMDVRGPVPTRDEMANRLFAEIHAGRQGPHGGIIVDLRGASGELKEYIRKFLPALARLRYFGIDLFQQPVEVVPAAHTTLGGTRIDEQTRTRVPRLLAAGEVAGNVHGANRLAGQAWTDCIVFGFQSGETAAQLVRASGDVRVDLDAARTLAAEYTAYLAPKRAGRRPHEVKQQIKELAWKYIGLRRSRAALEEAVQRLRTLQDEGLPELTISDAPGYNLDKHLALQVRFMALAAEQMARASLLREESRGTHYREDFPHRDDQRWLRHTIVRQEGGRMVTDTAPVIMTRLLPESVATQTEVKDA